MSSEANEGEKKDGHLHDARTKLDHKNNTNSMNYDTIEDPLTEEPIPSTSAPPHWGKLISMDPDKYDGIPYLERGKTSYTLTRKSIRKGDRRLSNRHCRIDLEIEDNREVVYIEDHSKNGTRVNNTTLKRGGRLMLEHGSEIVLASKRGEEPEISFAFERPRRQERGFEDVYQKLRELGEGAEGSVWECKHRQSGKLYALKMIKKSEFKSNKNYLNELNTLQDLRHKNIIKIYDTFSDKEHLYLIEELASRDLFKEIVDGQISEDKARGLVNSILDALEFMHKRSPKIIHADLKPENILVSKGVLKIADFGLAQMLKHGENYTQNETVLGSIPYMSPEATKGCCGQEGDLWSLGVILYVMLAKHMPFPFKNKAETFRRIRKGKFIRSPEFQKVSMEAKEVIENLLKVDLKERWTIEQVRSSSWMVPTSNERHVELPHGSTFPAKPRESEVSGRKRSAVTDIECPGRRNAKPRRDVQKWQDKDIKTKSDPKLNKDVKSKPASSMKVGAASLKTDSDPQNDGNFAVTTNSYSMTEAARLGTVYSKSEIQE